MDTIIDCNIRMPNRFGKAQVWGKFKDGSERVVFEFYHDELHFREREFIGLTEDQARNLFTKRDVEYLQS